MPIKQAVTSKGMIAGVFLMCLGTYVAISVGDVTGGMSIIGLGLGILGIRDAR